jgi:hypothetical protein
MSERITYTLNEEGNFVTGLFAHKQGVVFGVITTKNRTWEVKCLGDNETVSVLKKGEADNLAELKRNIKEALIDEDAKIPSDN